MYTWRNNRANYELVVAVVRHYDLISVELFTSQNRTVISPIKAAGHKRQQKQYVCCLQILVCLFLDFGNYFPFLSFFNILCLPFSRAFCDRGCCSCTVFTESWATRTVTMDHPQPVRDLGVHLKEDILTKSAVINYLSLVRFFKLFFTVELVAMLWVRDEQILTMQWRDNKTVPVMSSYHNANGYSFANSRCKTNNVLRL